MPYNPSVNDNSGQILAQGISGAGQSISEAIDTYTQRARQTKAYRQMAVDGLGLDPDDVDKMSLSTLQGKMQGMALKAANQQRQAQTQDLLSQIQQRVGIGNRQQAQADALNQKGAAWQRFVQSQGNDGGADASGLPTNPLAQAGPGGMDTSTAMGVIRGAPTGPAPADGGGFDPVGMMRKMTAAGVDPKDALENVKAMMAAGQMGGGAPQTNFAEDPITGFRALINGKTTTPTGVNPAKVKQPPSFPVVDPTTGKPTGDMMVAHPGKQGFFISKGKNNASAGDGPTMSKDGKFYFDDAAKNWKPIHVVGSQSAFTQAMSAGGATAPAAATYKSPNDVRAAFKAGTLSQPDATKILQTQFGLK